MIVDTNAWIELVRKRGDASVKSAMLSLVSRREAWLCGAVKMEFLGGIPHKEIHVARQRLSLFPSVETNPRIWEETGSNYSRLRAVGLTIPWNDVLIATSALLADCRLYTLDNHFQLAAPIIGLKLYAPGDLGTFRPENEHS